MLIPIRKKNAFAAAVFSPFGALFTDKLINRRILITLMSNLYSANKLLDYKQNYTNGALNLAKTNVFIEVSAFAERQSECATVATLAATQKKGESCKRRKTWSAKHRFFLS